MLTNGSTTRFLGAVSFFGVAAAIVFAAATTAFDSISQASLVAVAIAFAAIPRVAEGLTARGFRIASPGLLVPLAGIVLLAFLQMIPLPGVQRVSADPYNTGVFAVTFGSLVIAFEVLSRYADSDFRLRALVGTVIAVGAVSAVLGLIGRFDPDLLDALLGAKSWANEGFAQFRNRNHFAFIVEMAAGMLLGLLIAGRHGGGKRLVGWLLLAMMAFSVVASSSRGGMVSIAAIVVFAVFVSVVTSRVAESGGSPIREFAASITKRRIGKFVVATGLSVLVGLLLWTGIAFVGGDYVATRFERVDDEILAAEPGRLNRNAIWRASLELARERPLFGSGFGAYAQAIPQFDQAPGRFQLEEAHNDYLEMLASGGIVGLALFGAFGLLAAFRIKRNLQNSDLARRQYYLGASAGIVGVLVHSFVDFGLHIMVNALVFTALIVIGTVEMAPETDPRTVS